MSTSTLQFFHPLAIRGLSVRGADLPRPLVLPEYLRLAEREELVTLLLTCLRAGGAQPGNLIRLGWADRQALLPASDANAPATFTLENDDLLWLTVNEPVEEAALFQFVDAADALVLLDLRFPGGSEYVQWLAVLKGSLLSAIQRSWERHAHHTAVDFRRAGGWFESPLDVLAYSNHLAAGVFAGHSLSYSEHQAISAVLAARAADLPVMAVKALLLYALLERPEVQGLSKDETEFPPHFADWRAAGLGWVVGDEFTPLPALERLAEVEVLTAFVAHWSREDAANEELHKLRETLQHALVPAAEPQTPLLLMDNWLRPSIPLNPEGTCGTPALIRADIAPLFAALPPNATDAQLQQASLDEQTPSRRYLLLAWRAALWLEQADGKGIKAEQQAEAAVRRTLNEVWERLMSQSEDALAARAASTWARLRCVLADRWSEQARIADAARLLPQSLEQFELALPFFRTLNEPKNAAEVLHEMANLHERRSSLSRALDLWAEARDLFEQIGDVKGKAATLHNMAGVIAQQGDVARALALWQESLALLEQIGDVKGKAATLANMAWAAGQTGDDKEERRLNLEAARALAQVRAWLDLVTVLGNLGAGEDEDATIYLAQALWLTLRIGVPLNGSVNLAGRLWMKLGPAADAAPLVAAGAMLFAQTRGEHHPQREQYQGMAMQMMGACAEARGLASETEFVGWFTGTGLNDAGRFVPQLDAALTAMVGTREWLFDRELFGR